MVCTDISASNCHRAMTSYYRAVLIRSCSGVSQACSPGGVNRKPSRCASKPMSHGPVPMLQYTLLSPLQAAPSLHGKLPGRVVTPTDVPSAVMLLVLLEE